MENSRISRTNVDVNPKEWDLGRPRMRWRDKS